MDGPSAFVRSLLRDRSNYYDPRSNYYGRSITTGVVVNYDPVVKWTGLFIIGKYFDKRFIIDKYWTVKRNRSKGLYTINFPVDLDIRIKTALISLIFMIVKIYY